MTKTLRRTAAPVLATALFALLVWLGQGQSAAADSLTFSGTVLTPTGTPYSGGGGVNLWNNSGFGAGSGIDADGRFEITGIQPGTYTVDVGVPSDSAYANAPQQQVTITTNVTNFQLRVAAIIVRGTLAKPDATPTNGCVNIRNASWTVNRGYCAGDDGKFKIGALEAGSYILEANVPDNVPYVNTEQAITIADPTTTLDVGTVKFESPFIVGVVAKPDGSLLTWDDDWSKRLHLSVDLWNSDWTINKHSNYDNQSRFKFGRVPAGTYTLHVNVWDSETYTGSENVTLTVPATGLDLTATQVRLTTPQLSGVVYRPDGRTPVQNAWVNLHQENGPLGQGSNTDANGQYRIGGLPAGTYKFEVNPPQEMTDVVRTQPEDVTITSSLTTKNVVLTAAAKFITGSVKKADGTPVTCAQVNANLRGGPGWANTRTRSDGTYTLTVQPGSWNVRIERDGGFDCPEPDWIYLDPEAVVEFSADSSTETETVNFIVQKATAGIVGTVLTKDGRPVTNGNVNANSQTRDGRNRWANAQIKADGSYRLALIGGTYDLNVWTNDPKLFTKNQKVTVGDKQTLTVNFTMAEKLAHITGTVTDKAGKPLPSIQLNGNLDCGPDGCSAWSNTRTDDSGRYDMAVTAGRWNINIDGGQSANYVYDGPPVDVYVSSDTATVSDVNFTLTYADITITGKVVDESGKPFAQFSGWAYVRPVNVAAGAPFREYGGGVNQGVFSFRVPSKLYSQAELGIHTPPNSQYSATPVTITLVADATIEQNITIKPNDAAIVGRLIDSSGLSLQSCPFRGEVFANTSMSWHGTQINPDCSYEISLMAGKYNVGYHLEESAGFLNRPPRDSQVTVVSGTRLEKNLTVISGDARATVLVLLPNNTPARRVWIWADNHEEIDQLRRQTDEKQRQEQQEEFRGPGDTRSPEEVFKYCSKKENEKECKDFKLPPGAQGPGGCKDALECTRVCKKDPKKCDKDASSVDKPKAKGIVLSNSVLRRKARIASLKLVKAQEEEGKEEPDDFFDLMIGTGTETNDKGVATLSLVSGHEYTINAGVPPESDFMPPKNARLDLRNVKSANVTLQLRDSDGKMTGFVTRDGTAVQNGWVGCWSEDGNSNGSPIFNGTYSINYTFNSTYHCDANSNEGEKFFRSEEHIITIGTQKSVRENFTLGEAKFNIPPPVSETFDSTQAHVITLTDGTTLNIPANTIASSGQVTVTANPTINVQSQKTARPLGYGYNFEAKDADNKVVSTFAGEITATFKYSDEQLSDAGIDEDSLIPSYWDAASKTWKKPTNITQDKENNTVTVRTNHFTAYALVSTSGKGRGRALTAVKSQKIRGITKITIGSGTSKKTITPFPKCKNCEIAVGTLVAGKSGQIVIAMQASKSADSTTAKVYDLTGKQRQTILPWTRAYKQGGTLVVEELNGNGWDDVAFVPNQSTKISIMDFAARKTYTVKPSGSGRIMAQALDVFGTGTKQLVTNIGKTTQVWRFGKKGFAKAGFDTRKLSVTDRGIERVHLQPTLRSIDPKSVSRKKSATITIAGENFGRETQVFLVFADSTLPAKKVKVKGERSVTATFDLTGQKTGKVGVMVVSDNVTNTWPNSLRIK